MLFHRGQTRTETRCLGGHERIEKALDIYSVMPPPTISVWPET